MQAKDILKSSVLDIVFDNRNKAYGAYDLRKYYKTRLVKALILMFLFVVLVSLLAFVSAKPKSEEVIKPKWDETIMVEMPKETEKPKEQRKQKPAPTQRVNADNFTNNLKVVKDVPLKDTLKNLRDNAIISDRRVETEDTPAVVLVGVTPDPGPPFEGPITKPVEPVEVDPTIPVDEEALDKQPEFPGGKAALRKFLMDHLVSPDALEEGEERQVKVRFLVGYDGKLQHFELVKDGGRIFNEEVFRVLKKMPTWTAGKSNGRSVAAYHTLPVTFVGEPE